MTNTYRHKHTLTGLLCLILMGGAILPHSLHAVQSSQSSKALIEVKSTDTLSQLFGKQCLNYINNAIKMPKRTGAIEGMQNKLSEYWPQRLGDLNTDKDNLSRYEFDKKLSFFGFLTETLKVESVCKLLMAVLSSTKPLLTWGDLISGADQELQKAWGKTMEARYLSPYFDGYGYPFFSPHPDSNIDQTKKYQGIFSIFYGPLTKIKTRYAQNFLSPIVRTDGPYRNSGSIMEDIINSVMTDKVQNRMQHYAQTKEYEKKDGINGEFMDELIIALEKTRGTYDKNKEGYNYDIHGHQGRHIQILDHPFRAWLQENFNSDMRDEFKNQSIFEWCENGKPTDIGLFSELEYIHQVGKRIMQGSWLVGNEAIDVEASDFLVEILAELRYRFPNQFEEFTQTIVKGFKESSKKEQEVWLKALSEYTDTAMKEIQGKLKVVSS